MRLSGPAGAAQQVGAPGQGEQVLTISAKTGMPIKSVQPAHGRVRGSADTYRVLRPTLADIEAGKF
ncbi:MAG TPA: hypothetical protein VMI73_10010 [Trebonia sp.]|nr:hypothetical protein [Trebonia sp.]